MVTYDDVVMRLVPSSVSSSASPNATRTSTVMVAKKDVGNATLRNMQHHVFERFATVMHLLDHLADEGHVKPGDRLTFVEFLQRVFPSWSIEHVKQLTAKYTDDSACLPTAEEIQDFIDTYGDRGTLTIYQLAAGPARSQPGESAHALPGIRPGRGWTPLPGRVYEVHECVNSHCYYYCCCCCFRFTIKLFHFSNS